jgi:NAD(P)-dependent dehydrogenase (short-subunit alcohol dehydrogenase family)
MILEKKAAVVYGTGAIGTAVARTFAREGATVFLAGRTLAKVEAVAGSIRDSTPARVYANRVDVLDEESVESHADFVHQTAARIDISFNAVGHDHFQGTRLVDLSPQRFLGPLADRLTSQFLTARAAARRMTEQRSGVILMITATPARMAIPLMASFGPACAAMEGLARSFATEHGPDGIRVVCLRSAGSPESPGLQLAFAAQAETLGTTPARIQQSIEDEIMLRRMPSLTDVAEMAAVMASDRANAMTATVVNLTCGSITD